MSNHQLPTAPVCFLLWWKRMEDFRRSGFFLILLSSKSVTRFNSMLLKVCLNRLSRGQCGASYSKVVLLCWWICICSTAVSSQLFHALYWQCTFYMQPTFKTGVKHFKKVDFSWKFRCWVASSFGSPSSPRERLRCVHCSVSGTSPTVSWKGFQWHKKSSEKSRTVITWNSFLSNSPLFNACWVQRCQLSATLLVINSAYLISQINRRKHLALQSHCV